MKSTKEVKNAQGKESIRIFPNNTSKEFSTEDELRDYLLNDLPTRVPPGRYNFLSFRSVRNIPSGTLALFRFQDMIIGWGRVKDRAKKSSAVPGYEGYMIIDPSIIHVLKTPLSIKRLEDIIKREKTFHFKQNYKTGRGYRIVPSKYYEEVLTEFNKLSDPASIVAKEDADYEDDEELRKEFSNMSQVWLRSKIGLLRSNNQIVYDVRGKQYKRDYYLISLIKAFRQYKCQICGSGILKKDGTLYVEAAQIGPTARGGSEQPENILILLNSLRSSASSS